MDEDIGDSKQPESVAAVLKVFAILNALGERSDIGITDLSVRLAMPKATVYRFLQTMKSLGYVRQEADSERYGLAMRMFEIGAKALPSPDLVDLAKHRKALAEGSTPWTPALSLFFALDAAGERLGGQDARTRGQGLVGDRAGDDRLHAAAAVRSGPALLRLERALDRPELVGAVEELSESPAAEDEETEATLGQQGTLGIGIPGAESLATGLIKNANSTCLIGKALRNDLQRRLRREIRLANDANCFALSEAVDGSGQGAKTVFGIILGTGVGGGIVIPCG